MLVSVIIPCYNVQNYILECLDSVFEQTYQNIEVICIDNNSTDNTFLVLQEAKEKYKSLKVDKEIKPGAPAARNKGLTIATGEWIQFLDADDLLLICKIEHQVNLINQYKDASFIAANYLIQDVSGKKYTKQIENDFWKGLFTTKLGITSSNLFRKSYLIDVGVWNETLESSQEYDLMFRLMKFIGQPLIDQEPLTIIRERKTGQISQRNPKEKWKQYLHLRIEMLTHIKFNSVSYFTQNESWYYQEFFLILRFLYPYDNDTSKLYFNQYLTKDFKPQISNANSFIYCLLFNFFGFETTETIKTFLKKF